MSSAPRTPWHPDRSWADPLIALLTLLALLAVGLTLLARRQSAMRPSERVSLQGRMVELALAGPRLVTGRAADAKEWAKAAAQATEPWDRALLAVLKVELEGRKEGGLLPPEAPAPAGPAGQQFRRVLQAAYAGGPLPDRAERDEVHRRLGKGYAADLLEARLRDREGGGDVLRVQARAALMTRLAAAGLLSLLVLGLAGCGLGVGTYLLATQENPPPRPLPTWSMSGRAALLVLLLWFLGYFLAGNLAGLLLSPFPGLRWAVVPLGYGLHAGLGFRLLCWAEGLSPGDLWQRVAPGPVGRDLAWGGAFLGLAVLLVIAVALTSNLLLRPEQSPQRDLQELLRGLSGWLPSLLLFLTVAGLGPLWEELLFRGFLLPVLARRQRMTLALVVSALAFGAIHLQPVGLPVLSTLGWVLGLAMRQTGSLRAPVLVHACWNGGIFLLMRAFA